MVQIFKWEGGGGDSPYTVTGIVSPSDLSDEGRPEQPVMRVAGGGAAAFSRWSFTPTGFFSTAFYFKTPTSWPSASCNFFALRLAGSTTLLSLAFSGVGAPGQFRVVRNSGVILASTATGHLKTDTWYGVALNLNSSGSPGYVLADLWEYGKFSATLTTLSGEHPDIGDQDTVHADYGRVNSTPILESDLFFDSIRGYNTNSEAGQHPNEPDNSFVPGDPQYLHPIELQWPPDTSAPRPGMTMPGPNLTPSWITGANGNDVLQIDQVSGQSPHAQWNFDAQDAVSLSGYFYHTGWGSSAVALFGIRSASSLLSNLTIGGAGQPGNVRLMTSSGTVLVNSPSNVIAVNRWYRFELIQDSVNSRACASVYPMDSWAGPIWSSGWIVNTNFATKPDNVQVGRVNSSPTMPRFYIRNVAGDFSRVPPNPEGSENPEFYVYRPDLTPSGWYACEIVGVKGPGTRVYAMEGM